MNSALQVRRKSLNSTAVASARPPQPVLRSSTAKGLCKNKIRCSGGILTPGHPAFEDRQIRSPKSEIRNKFKIQKAPKLKPARGCLVLRFGFRSFGFVSDFGFRISDFEHGHDPSAERF